MLSHLPYWLITLTVAHASSLSPVPQETLGFLFDIVFVSLFQKVNFFSIRQNQVKRSCVVRNWQWEQRILTNWVRQVNSLINSSLCSVVFHVVTSLFMGTVWGGPAQDLVSLILNLPHTSMVRMVSSQLGWESYKYEWLLYSCTLQWNFALANRCDNSVRKIRKW